MLYGEITALCNEKGYCWATNTYFSDLYGASKRTIIRCITELEKNGYINTKTIYKKGTKEVEKRIITIVDTPVTKLSPPYRQNCHHPSDKNVTDNNTFNNTLNNKEKEIYKEKENKEYENLDELLEERNKKFIPPTLEEVEAYCVERNNNVDPKRFFDYYEVSDWKDQSGKQIKNWKQKLLAVWEKKTIKKLPPKRTEDRIIYELVE